MSDGDDQSQTGAQEEEQVEQVESTPQGATISVEDALKGVLKKALVHDGLARGLRECAKALDRQQAHVCVLSESCDDASYVKLVEALSAERKIPLIKVAESKKLGEWAGLCQLDKDGNPRKVVGCSCVVVTNFGEDSTERNVLLDHFKSR